MPIRLIRWVGLIAVTVAALVVLPGSTERTDPSPAPGAARTVETVAPLATPNTRPASIATAPTSSALDRIDWVVAGGAMSRGVAGERYSVLCVPRRQLGWDQTKQTHLREVQTGKDASYDAVDGERCPTGPILMEW